MAETHKRNEIIKLRASRRQKELIDQAAELLDRGEKKGTRTFSLTR